MNLGQRLRFYRKRKKNTQEETANEICSISYYSKIENNQVIPSEQILALLCNKLGLTLSELKEEKELIPNLVAKVLEIYRLIRVNNIEKCKQLYNDIVKNYSDNDNPVIIFIVNLIKLRMYLLDSNFEKAKIYYDKVIEFRGYQDIQLVHIYNRICGLYNYLMGNLKTSLSFYQYLEQMENYEPIEEVYYQMALIYNRLNNLSLSSSYLEKALGIFAVKMDYEQCINCNLILGVNYRKMNDYVKSIDCYNSILSNSYSDGNKLVIGKVYHNLGIVYSKMKKSELAIKHFHKSLSIKENKYTLATTLYLLSKENYTIGDNIEAFKWLEKGKTLAEKFNNEGYTIKLKVLELLINQDDIELYVKNITIPYFEKKNDVESLEEFVRLLADYYEGRRKYKNGFLLLKKYYLKGMIK